MSSSLGSSNPIGSICAAARTHVQRGASSGSPRKSRRDRFGESACPVRDCQMLLDLHRSLVPRGLKSGFQGPVVAVWSVWVGQPPPPARPSDRSDTVRAPNMPVLQEGFTMTPGRAPLVWALFFFKRWKGPPAACVLFSFFLRG